MLRAGAGNKNVKCPPVDAQNPPVPGEATPGEATPGEPRPENPMRRYAGWSSRSGETLPGMDFRVNDPIWYWSASQKQWLWGNIGKVNPESKTYDVYQTKDYKKVIL